MGLARPGILPARSASVGTVAYSSSGLELRTPDSGEEDVVFAAGLGKPRDEGRAHKGEAEAVGAGSGLLLGLAAQAEGFGVESGVRAHPEDRSMGLVGIEAAEVAAAAAAEAATAAAAATEAFAAKAAAEQAAGAGEESASAEAGQEAVYERPEWSSDGRSLYCLSDAQREMAAPAMLDIASGQLTYLVEPDLDVDEATLDPTGQRLAYALNRDGEAEIVIRTLADGAEQTVPGPAARRAVHLLAERPGLGPLRASNWPSRGPPRAPARTCSCGLAPDAQLRQVTLAGGLGRRHARADRARARPVPDLRRSPDPGAVLSSASTTSGAGPAPCVVVVHGGPEGQYRPDVPAGRPGPGRRPASPCWRPTSAAARATGAPMSIWTTCASAWIRWPIWPTRVYWLRDSGRADPRRIAVYGGSYGGFMVLAALTTYPDLWAAGVDLVGIANFVSFLENTGPWRRHLREAEYGSLENDREFLEEISPINHVEQITRAAAGHPRRQRSAGADRRSRADGGRLQAARPHGRVSAARRRGPPDRQAEKQTGRVPDGRRFPAAAPARRDAGLEHQAGREQVDRVAQAGQAALFAQRSQHRKQRRRLGLAADRDADGHEERPGLPLAARLLGLEGGLDRLGGKIVERAERWLRRPSRRSDRRRRGAALLGQRLAIEVEFAEVQEVDLVAHLLEPLDARLQMRRQDAQRLLLARARQKRLDARRNSASSAPRCTCRSSSRACRRRRSGRPD